MRYVKLGSTGLDVSKICLGCMSYGVSERGAHEWTLGEDESRTFIRCAIEAGTKLEGDRYVPSCLTHHANDLGTADPM